MIHLLSFAQTPFCDATVAQCTVVKQYFFSPTPLVSISLTLFSYSRHSSSAVKPYYTIILLHLPNLCSSFELFFLLIFVLRFLLYFLQVLLLVSLLFFMSFCRILSTLCSQVVFHNVPHFSRG